MRPAAADFAPFTVRSDTALLRAACFDNDAPAGLCVLLNGQTEFIEKYFEVIDELRGRGFGVVTMDWRGQGGSQRLLPDPRKGHIPDFALYDADLAALMREVVAPRAKGRKPVALAHSMGGHILLRRLHDIGHEFAGAILCAPMLAIKGRGTPWRLVTMVSRFLNAKAPSPDFVWGMAKRDQRTLPFAVQLVTSDTVRYARAQALLRANPDLALNGPTWGWLAAALKSILALQAPGYPEAIDTPALLVGAGKDLICDSEAVRRFARRLPHGTFLDIAGAGHEILMERDIYRTLFWSAFDDFIASVNRAQS